MSEPVYSRITEAEEMIRELCKRQPKMLWRVRPNMIAVYGNETKERPDSCKEDAVIQCVKGINKAIMQDNHIPTRFHIKIYWSDWRTWKENKKQKVLVEQLLRVHEEAGKLIKPDVEGFRIILDKTGVKDDSGENFPNLLLEEVEFDLSLLPKTEDAEEENDEINEETEKKKRGRPKKEVAKEEVEVKKDNPELASNNVKKEEQDPDGDVFV